MGPDGHFCYVGTNARNQSIADAEKFPISIGTSGIRPVHSDPDHGRIDTAVEGRESNDRDEPNRA
jgi:hypothetical protein